MAKVKSFMKAAYPLSAQEAVEAGMSDKELIRCAITKWSHLDVKTLNKYGLVKSWYKVGYFIGSEFVDVLWVIDTTCTLCVKYIHEYPVSCKFCPIFKSRDGVKCFDRTSKEKISPYHEWVENGDPQPMLKALEKALQYTEGGS